MKLWTLNFAIAGAVMAAGPLMAQSSSAGTLLQQVKAEAQTIETHAAQMERLAERPNAQWAQFDQQWNEIKPAQEALQMKIDRLEKMRASLSDQQRKMLDDSKQAAQMISARTHELFRMIDQQGADLTSPTFRADARSLAKDAYTVARAS